jgi:hemoglobin/transferrin/lactoferrin receptor protein
VRRNIGISTILFILVLTLMVAAPMTLAADEDEAEKAKKEDPKEAGLKEKVVVTATRTEEDVFQVPQPVSVVTEEEIKEQTPNTATDLLRNLPGVDVNGVGTSQPRPIIRGQRGQRILLLEDGIRMNTSRRQSDFGELPALVDVGSMERVEVVRGPGSVLYGSDAIGGVVNMITRTPPGEDGLQGTVGYRLSTADSQSKPSFNLLGRHGGFSYLLGASHRDAESYKAPAGTYGDITLSDETLVNDSGVTDKTYNARLGWDFKNGHEMFFKVERYDSEDAGFGWVSPSAYNPADGTEVQLTYPFQEVTQYVLGYKGNNLETSWVDSQETTFYYRNNERRFDQRIDIPFFPGAGLEILSENFTDIETFGLRSELRKIAGSRHVLTYGVDYYQDDALSTNFSQETIYGFGPPMVTTDNTPTLPNATYESLGMFAQDRIRFTDRFDAIVGVRYQDVTAETEDTPLLPLLDNFKSTDSTGVWATNLIYKATENIKIVGSVGTAFRSPNLIERFFDGPTPEGGAYQARNLELEAETSLNVDLGMKYRRDNVYLELTAFQNTIKDGISIVNTGEFVDPPTDPPTPIYQNINVDKLRYKGVELALDWMFVDDWFLGLNYTHLTGEDISQGIDEALGNSYSDKYNVQVRYQPQGGRFWVEAQARRNGDQKDAILAVDNPIGDIYPAFTVYSLRSGVTLHEARGTTHRLGFAIENMSDVLYAEFSNASFFRPEPERSYVLNYVINFK